MILLANGTKSDSLKTFTRLTISAHSLGRKVLGS